MAKKYITDSFWGTLGYSTTTIPPVANLTEEQEQEAKLKEVLAQAEAAVKKTEESLLSLGQEKDLESALGKANKILANINSETNKNNVSLNLDLMKPLYPSVSEVYWNIFEPSIKAQQRQLANLKGQLTLKVKDKALEDTNLFIKNVKTMFLHTKAEDMRLALEGAEKIEEVITNIDSKIQGIDSTNSLFSSLSINDCLIAVEQKNELNALKELAILNKTLANIDVFIGNVTKTASATEAKDILLALSKVGEIMTSIDSNIKESESNLDINLVVESHPSLSYDVCLAFASTVLFKKNQLEALKLVVSEFASKAENTRYKLTIIDDYQREDAEVDLMAATEAELAD